MANNDISFENEELRGKYAREIRKSFEENNLGYWWVSPSANSANKPEIFISPKPKKDRDWIWENLPTISRISVQINGGGKPSFGISGYHPFQIANTKGKFEERGYIYHHYDTNKFGKKEQKRWWLTKSLDNLESISEELKSIESLLFEKN